MIYRIALHLKIKYLLQRRCNVTFPYLQIHLISSSIYPPSCLSYPLLYISHTVSLCVHLRRLFPLFSTLLPTLCSTLKDAIVEAITSKRRKLPGTCDYLPRFPYLPSVALFLMNSAMNLPPRRKNSRVKKGEMLYEYERLARRRFDASNEY